MSNLVMARSTALWLVRNTALKKEQIARSCGLHILEVRALETSALQGENPLLNGQLTAEEIQRCEADPTADLTFMNPLDKVTGKKERRYTPLASRQDRPRGILWLVKNHPELSNGQIAKLLSTTTKTAQAIRDGTHPLVRELKPHNPVLLGLCTNEQLQQALNTARKRAPKIAEPAEPLEETTAS